MVLQCIVFKVWGCSQFLQNQVMINVIKKFGFFIRYCFIFNMMYEMCSFNFYLMLVCDIEYVNMVCFRRFDVESDICK